MFMIRKELFISMVMVLASATGVWAAGETMIVAEGSPQIISVVGSVGNAEIAACRYPQFIEGGSNNNPECAARLRSPAISLAPRRGTCPSALQPIQGLEQNVSIPVEYLGTASVMVNWTVRVEGVSEPLNPQDFCGRTFGGTMRQSFPGGKVSTRLLTIKDGKETVIGLPAEMTLPDSGIVTTTSIADPTISGSYVIKPKDFCPGTNKDCLNPKLPRTLNVKVYWSNDTCMKVQSRAGFRSMVITMVPQGAQ